MREVSFLQARKLFPTVFRSNRTISRTDSSFNKFFCFHCFYVSGKHFTFDALSLARFATFGCACACWCITGASSSIRIPNNWKFSAEINNTFENIFTLACNCRALQNRSSSDISPVFINRINAASCDWLAISVNTLNWIKQTLLLGLPSVQEHDETCVQFVFSLLQGRNQAGDKLGITSSTFSKTCW